MDYGFFADGQEQALRGETKGSTPFLVVKAKPSMMILYSATRRQIKETVESTVRSVSELPMRAFRDAVVTELKQRFGDRAIAQAPPK